MLQTLAILLAAHFFADFILWPERSPRVRGALARGLFAAAMAAAFLGGAPVGPLVMIATSHAVMSAVKHTLMQGRGWTDIGRFVLDQCAQCAVAVVLAVTYPGVAAEGFWLRELPAPYQRWYMIALTVTCGAIICIVVGGAVIGILTRPLLEEIKEARRAASRRGAPESDGAVLLETESELEGLRRGGRYIGWLERSMVLMLVLMDQVNAVGFIVAAKSILRYGDIKDAHQRRVTEYVIIGTFLSFGWAMLVAVLTRHAIRIW